MIIFMLTISIGKINSLAPSGPTNRFYSIPYYYGSRVNDWNNTRSYFDDFPVTFFWSHSWNIDFKGNLWVVDKVKHSIYNISKEKEDFNSLSKVSGREYVTGALNGNIAMGLFNSPVSLTIFANNSTERRMQDKLRPIVFYDKFFKKMDKTTRLLKERCMRWVSEYNYTECGELIPKEHVQAEYSDP